MRGFFQFCLLLYIGVSSPLWAQQSLSEFEREIAKHSDRIRLPEIPESEAEAYKLVSDFIAASSESVEKIQESSSNQELLFRIDAFFSELSILSAGLDLVLVSHPNEKLRKACAREFERLQDWLLQDVLSDQDIYERLESIDRPKTNLSREEYELLKTFKSYFSFMLETDGSEHTKQVLRNISRSVERIENEFNLNADSSRSLQFTKKQLEGVPEFFLDEVRDSSGKYIVCPSTWWHYALISRTARRSATRLAVERARFQVAMDSNPPIMKALVELRYRLAQEIGFDSWLEHQVFGLSLPTEKEAFRFVESIHKANAAGFEAEQEIVRRQKAKKLRQKDAQIYAHDFRFYLNEEAKDRYDVDLSRLNEVFPLESVLAGLEKRLSQVFEVEFKALSSESLWHPSLRAYSVRDGNSGRALGVLILDLFPRDGKDGWFFNTNLSPGRALENGGRQLPVTLVSGNFPPPTAGRPSLLFYQDIETLLHEMGHALHNLLSKTKSSTLFGYYSAEDFVETPSTFLEFWAQDPAFIRELSRHYETGEKLSLDEARNIIEAAKLGKAHERQHLIARSILDLKLHSAFKLDGSLPQVNQQVFSEYFYPLSDHSLPLASFTHITSGYDGLMWIYLMGEVLGHKIAQRFLNSREGFESQKHAKRLVETMLSQGGIHPTKRMARNFLHRSFDPCRAVFEMLPRAD